MPVQATWSLVLAGNRGRDAQGESTVMTLAAWVGRNDVRRWRRRLLGVNFVEGDGCKAC